MTLSRMHTEVIPLTLQMLTGGADWNFTATWTADCPSCGADVLVCIHQRTQVTGHGVSFAAGDFVVPDLDHDAVWAGTRYQHSLTDIDLTLRLTWSFTLTCRVDRGALEPLRPRWSDDLGELL